MSWDVWTVSKPCLWPVVIRSNPAADAECGGEGSEGTIAAPLHRQPLRLGHLNSSRPMAAGEPVTTRVKFCQEPQRGHSKCFRVSFAQVSHDEELSEGPHAACAKKLSIRSAKS